MKLTLFPRRRTVRTVSLYSAVAVLLGAAGLRVPARAQSGTTLPPNTIAPYVVCNYVRPTGNVMPLIGYDSSYASPQTLIPGTPVNSFMPGGILGQPEVFEPGTDTYPFVVAFSAFFTPVLTYTLDGHKVTITADLPPCNAPYFVPAPPLSFAGPGTYPSQYLGQITNSPAVGPGLTVIAAPVSSSANLSFSNLTYSATQPTGVPISPAQPQFLYGDVTVGPGPSFSTGVLLAVNSGTTQVALGMDTVSATEPAASTAGCAANVTAGLQVTSGLPVQLFGTEIWTQLLRIKNTSGAAISGPIEVALTGLSSNAKLFTASGNGTCPGIAGAPYIFITNGLAANAYGAVVLTFTNSQIPSSAIQYTPVFVAGGSQI